MELNYNQMYLNCLSKWFKLDKVLTALESLPFENIECYDLKFTELAISLSLNDRHPCNHDIICYGGRILLKLTISTAFRNFYILKFILDFNNEHAQNFSCHRTTFAF